MATSTIVVPAAGGVDSDVRTLAAQAKADIEGLSAASLASTSPADVGVGAASAGSAATASKSDHVHHLAVTVSTVTATKLADISGNSLPAKGVTMHAQDPGGGALNLTSGFTLPLPRRNIQIVRSNAGATPLNYVVTGTAPGGAALTETISAAKGATTAGTKCFATITSITTASDPVSTTDFTTGDLFSVGEPVASLVAGSCIGVVESMTLSDAASGAIASTTAPNGTKSFSIAYTATHTHTLS